MNTFDIAIIAVGIFGLVIWIRGCRRRSISDCVLGLVLGVVAGALYFFLFSLTRTAWLAAIIFSAYALALLPFRQMLRGIAGRALAGSVIVLIASAAIGEYKYVSAGNALLVIEPYRSGKGWAFDGRDCD